MVMIPERHQLEMADEALKIIKGRRLVYLAAQERTGKTLVAVLVAEKLDAVLNILVVTKKKAIDGWEKTLKYVPHKKTYEVINYESVHKLSRSSYDLVIIDEAHNKISGYPKKSVAFKALQMFTEGKDIIYMSATPHAQGYQLLYHQLALSSFSPWARYKNFYRWFEDYGVPNPIYTNRGVIESYTKTKAIKVLADIKPYFIVKTRKELGFPFEPNTEKHFINLDKGTRANIKKLRTDGILKFSDCEVVCDTTMKLMHSLYLLENGSLQKHVGSKDEANREKIDYIKKLWGGCPSTAIYYNYVADGELLAKHLKGFYLLQATTHAEGVDLTGVETIIIFSMDFSTARHVQRKARQASKYRETPITVHYILCENELSHDVFESVETNNKNYVTSMFERSL